MMRFAMILFSVLAVCIGIPCCQANAAETAVGGATVPTTAASAESRDYMLRALSLPQLWDANFICSVQAEEAKSSSGSVVKEVVRLKVKQDFGDTAAPDEFVVPTWVLLREPSRPISAKAVAPGKTLILCVSREGQGSSSARGIYAIPTLPSDAANLLAPLELIYDYRKAAGDEEKGMIAKKIFAGKSALAAQYVCRDWSKASVAVTDEQRTWLLGARNESSLDMYTRLLASRTLRLRDVSYGSKGEHVAWLRQWFKEPGTLDYRTWDEMLTDLTQFGDPQEMESSTFPMIVKLLHSPAMKEAEAQAILQWLSTLSLDKRIGLETQDKVIAFLIDEAFAYPEDTKTTLSFLRAALCAMSQTAARCFQLEKSATNVSKGKQLLVSYEGRLSKRLKSTEDAGVKSALQDMIAIIKATLKRADDY